MLVKTWTPPPILVIAVLPVPDGQNVPSVSSMMPPQVPAASLSPIVRVEVMLLLPLKRTLVPLPLPVKRPLMVSLQPYRSKPMRLFELMPRPVMPRITLPFPKPWGSMSFFPMNKRVWPTVLFRAIRIVSPVHKHWLLNMMPVPVPPTLPNAPKYMLKLQEIGPAMMAMLVAYDPTGLPGVPPAIPLSPNRTTEFV